MERDGRRAPGVAHAVDAGRFEVEDRSGGMPVAHLADRALLEEQTVLGELSIGDVDRTAGRVVVVEARVLLAVPADEPDVEVDVAVEPE